MFSRRDARLRPWRRAYPPSIIVKNPVCDGYFRVDSCRREGAQPLSLLPTIRLCNFPWLSQTAALFHDAPDCGKISASMSGAVQSAVTAAGRGCVAALALALVLHGSTKRPPLRQSAAPSCASRRSVVRIAAFRGAHDRCLGCARVGLVVRTTVGAAVQSAAFQSSLLSSCGKHRETAAAFGAESPPPSPRTIEFMV